ncbi:hypothetical protein [Pyxidicoccus xibeiensis]|uniref:hypothetical protein n=1 Tax=Pyxidicoccus xibeiensis TaxID=2906759 RepID=UPI0020A82425|nr:hypothetical protein [Pyxidicoccus xibeiensis]MCP3140008.1 hypothetical protein [Pyxidicoccus xibeiensis]
MSPLRSLLCATLALGLLLGATPAEARFGKRSKPSESNTHEATPVGEEDSGGDDEDDDDDDSHSDGHHYVSDPVGDTVNAVNFFAFIFSGGNHRLSVAPEPGPDGELVRERHAAPLSFRLGAQGGPLGGGGAVDLFIGLEGRRFGVDARLTGLGLPTDDGSEGSDTISLVEAHLTWALVSLERVRLRAEAGVSTASAPDIDFVGASMGMSLEACIGGPLDVETRVQATPFPYRQVDASAALALHLGALVLRGGYRGMVLDDAGLVDGVTHVDTFHGPFFGAGLTY